MNVQELGEEYRNKTNKELLRLALSPEQLTPDVFPIGVGRMRFGKANRVCDPETDIERFKTTIFLVLLCFPLIPTGTYLVERKRVRTDKLTGIERLPLDWEQVLKVWVVAAGAILTFIWLIKIVTSDAVWRLLHRH
jgi:hypothetical protein